MNLGQMPALAAQQTTGTTTTPSPTTGQAMSDTFLQLLVAQLKSQSPLNPVDPDQFIGQLAQFNSLSELIRIREILQGVPAKTAANGAVKTS